MEEPPFAARFYRALAVFLADGLRTTTASQLALFRKAMKRHPTPRVITLDAYAASHRAITELKAAGAMPQCVRIRSSKYLNSVVEQDHRRIKHRDSTDARI